MNHRCKTPVEKILRRAYKRAECQARYRGEDWNVSWEHWYNTWMINDRYKNKGRSNESLIFCRIDFEKGWNDNNTDVLLRYDHLQTTINRNTIWKNRKNVKYKE